MAQGQPEDSYFGGSSSASGLDGPLTSRKSAIRRLAIDKPGSLLSSGLEGFREDLVQVSDEVDENSKLQPICSSWFRSIFCPNHQPITVFCKYDSFIIVIHSSVI